MPAPLLARYSMSATLSLIGLLAALTATSLITGLVPVHAKTPAIYTGYDKLAVGGYDPVAYFVHGMPVKGSPQLTTKLDGVTWRFSSEANRAAFVADPSKYAPQYGGHCAWAVSEGYTASADPTVWKIVNGKLYLNYNASVGRTWEKSVAANISRADANWPKMLAK